MKSKHILSAGVFAANSLIGLLSFQWLGCASNPGPAPEGREHRFLKQWDFTLANPIDASGCRIAIRESFRNSANNVTELRAYERTGLDAGEGKLLTGATSITREVDGANAAHLADYQILISEQVTRAQDNTRNVHVVSISIFEEPSGQLLDTCKATNDTSWPAAFQRCAEQITQDLAGENLRAIANAALHPDPSNLDRLLGARDFTASQAKERNHALLSARTLTLPGLLQSSKTSELLSLKVKMEQAVLDLEHNSELDKEAAEAAFASGADPEQRREMSLVYRERISLLKPMLASINEEIVNRQR